MDYSKIIAVTGLPGLQELISSKNDGAIVRSLEDNTTKFVSSRIHNFSHLESIEIYTVRENVNLVEIFNAMEKSSTGLPDEKDAKAVRAYFEKVYPDIDFERVYNSDMKKMVKWYSVLKENNIEIKLAEIPEEEEEEEVVEEAPKPAKKKEEKPAAPAKKEKEVKVAEKPKKAAAKKKEEKPAPKAKKEETPKKKAAPAAKKETDKKKEAPKKKTPPKKK